MKDVFINLGLLALATFFILMGIVLIMRGSQRRSRRFSYDVGRLAARGAGLMAWLQGFILLSVGVVLFAFWAFYDPNAAANELEATEVVLTETKVKVTIALESEDGEAIEQDTGSLVTVEPSGQTDSALLEVVAPTVVPTQAAPTAPPAPTEVPIPPTPTPIPIPTATPGPPVDGVVDIIGGLNLRNEPNGQLIITLIENGNGVFFLEGQEEAGGYVWIKVETLAGEVGWVASDFVIPTE